MSKSKHGNIVAKMTRKEVKEYKDEVKKQAIEELPAALKIHNAAITSAVARSQVPMPANPKSAVLDTQEASVRLATFDLTNVLANILYGLQATPAQPSARNTLYS